MISVKDRKFNGKIVSNAVGGITSSLSWKGKLVIRFLWDNYPLYVVDNHAW
jgi:hypothetical protein